MLPRPPVASSSRQPIPIAPSPPRAQRRLRRSTTAFVFSLCLPYIAAANPLPQDPLTHHRPRIRSTSESAISGLHSIVTTVMSRRSDEMQPTLALMNSVTLPDGFVKLHQHFNPGFIVLSYIIAFVGSLCTLELLIRRTTNSGWRNQLLLASAGICFGAVSTFAMHFIFNNALSLHHPDMNIRNYPALYLAYNPGFTVLSLVVSCLAMTFAFFVMGTRFRDWICIPGSKERRKQHKREKQDTDEYGKWKRSHKKVKRRATMGVTALFAHASSVAKWSLMDVDESSPNPMKEKDAKWPEEYSHAYDGGSELQGDTELQELEFRLGRSAVRSELEKRTGTTSQDSRGPSRNHSYLIDPPLPAVLNDSRRGSLTEPSFHFPARTLESPSSQRTGSPSYNDPSPIDTRRRASLPVNTFTRTDRPSYSGASGLARIQSLPEAEQDLAPSSSRGSSSDGVKREDTKQTISEQLGALTTHEGPTGQAARKVKVIANGTRLARIGMFFGFDVVTVSEVAKIMITGALAGFGVVGMHYIGQASITGIPYIAYRPGYVIGSVIIACSAVIIALYIMFIMLRPKLKHTWLSKICVALILSVAVCAMHFCGMMGTTYGWPVAKGISRHNALTGTNAAITGIVAALAFVACIGCAVFFVLHSLNLRRERARRRRVVIAAILFDDRDRVLVNSTDGLLPMCDIASLTGGDVPQSTLSVAPSLSSGSTVLGMDLATGHEAFVSALKLTWAWKNPALSTFNPVTAGQDKQATLAASIADVRRGSMLTTHTTNTTTTGSRPVPLSTTKFLDKFALSACDLAVRLTGQADGVSRLGVLYDQILTTGWVRVNNGADTVSKGQLIFLVRRVVSGAERSDLESRHLIFADSQAVAGALQKTLSVPIDHTMPLLDDIRSFCDSTLHTNIQPGKLYGGVAVVQATPFDGLRLLLEKDMRSQLPMREMCAFNTTSINEDELTGTVDEIGEALALLQGMNILSVITRNMTFSSDQVLSKRVLALLSAMERAIVPMLDEMLTAEDMEHILPRLTLHPMLVPLTPGGARRNLNSYVPPYLIVFYANYDAAVNTFTDKWLPFSLFRAQNACVMAPKISAATTLDQLYATDTEEPEGNAVRRPSKVQFEFPASTPAATQTPTPVPPPPAAADNLFSGFTFPPRNDQPQPGNRSSSIRASSVGPAGGPRRSSLARSRFGSIGESTELGYREVATGVAQWDQEWLLNLLKTKLRADA